MPSPSCHVIFGNHTHMSKPECLFPVYSLFVYHIHIMQVLIKLALLTVIPSVYVLIDIIKTYVVIRGVSPNGLSVDEIRFLLLHLSLGRNGLSVDEIQVLTSNPLMKL